MSVKTQVWSDGVLVREWDDATRTYHEYDAAGVETLARPYGPEENADADARAAAAQARTDRETARTAVRAIVTDLQAEKARCDVVLAKTAAQITGGDTKDVARAAKRIADAAIDLARLVKDM